MANFKLVLVYFIYGLPFETEESMKKTLSFAKTLNADLVTFGIATPHPGTKFFEFMDKNSYIKHKSWELYNPMLPPPYDYPLLKSDFIYKFANKSYRSYYLRPGFILKRLLKFRLFQELSNFAGFVKRYILNG